jgi:hypothetical protein
LDLTAGGITMEQVEPSVASSIQPATPLSRTAPQMNDELKAKCDRIRELLGKATADDIYTRYQVGRLVVEVMDNEATYGSASVKRMAKALHQGYKTLYRHAEVARSFEPKELDEIVRSAKDQRLCWSHLAELALVESKAERDELLQATIAEKLSVPRLRRLISPPPAKPPADRSEAGGIQAGVTELRSMAETFVSKAGIWNEQVFVPLKESSDAASPAVVEDMRLALTELARLEEAVTSTKQQLEAALAAAAGSEAAA